MNRSMRLALLITLGIRFCGLQEAIAQDVLSPVLSHDLKRLEETWNLLDQVATKVWPGWTNYLDVPFLFQYPDGRQLLVGHPNPPEGFAAVEKVEIRGKKVYVDNRNAIAMDLRPPVFGGGGPQSVGNVEGKPVETVVIHLSAPQIDSNSSGPLEHVAARGNERSRLQRASENQILLYVHELFHCHQSTVYTCRYGNLRYNTDENFATYAEIEGQALEKAYLEADTNRTREYLKDFVVARELKRRSMDTTEQLQESEEELIEGIATYAEIRTLELAKTQYTPPGMGSNDPFFYGFADADSLIGQKLDMLRTARAITLNATGKFYPYGAFQALLLGRFRPGWQSDFYQRKGMLDRLIADLVRLSEVDKRSVWERLKASYDCDRLFAKHYAAVKERNSAFEIVRNRKGVAFIVNFKKTHEFPGSRAAGKSYALGLMNAYPEGIEKIAMEDVLFTGRNSPMLLDQLFYVKWVDTDAGSLDGKYELKYSRREGDSVYYDAVLTTGGFVLKAPKIEFARSPNRIKVTILSKVKGG